MTFARVMENPIQPQIVLFILNNKVEIHDLLHFHIVIECFSKSDDFRLSRSGMSIKYTYGYSFQSIQMLKYSKPQLQLNLLHFLRDNILLR